ncbi:MAG: hypothetical protein DI537_32930 [Stutzerimonas stutzeri]|nr:MAG: hypothetical protein DI537_32930 [Stutzerimonas stutzeri]
MLDPAKIGYLRGTPPASAPGSPASGPTKAMRNKLVKSGHVAVEGALYRRTEVGDATIAAFDATLAPEQIELLRAVARGDKVSSSAPGFKKLLASGLLRITTRLETALTVEGKELISRL